MAVFLFKKIIFFLYCLSLFTPPCMAQSPSGNDGSFPKEAPSHEGESTISLFDKLQRQHIEYQIKRVEKAFRSLDRLFENVIIKAQKLDDKKQEFTSNLLWFISGQHELPKICSIIEEEMGRKLSKEEILFLIFREAKASF